MPKTELPHPAPSRRTARIGLAALALTAAFGAGCKPVYSTNPTAFQGPKLDPRALVTLGPGDAFDVRVLGETELSGAYQVSQRGLIRFPLVGLIHVEGLTPTEVEERIRAALAKSFIRDPQVNVYVKEFTSKKIFVFGEVNKPGTFAYEPNMSIVQVITIAGGFTKTAWKNKTNVTRIMNGEEKKIEVPVEAIGEGKQRNFTIKPGDIIFVPESPI